MKSTLFNMIIAMLVLSVSTALILGYAYQQTAEPIERGKNQKILDAISDVVGTFDNDPFAERTTITTPDGRHKLEMYPARENGIITSIAIRTFSNNGFSGKIELIVGMLMDGTITGYKIVDQRETPGLGTKIAEDRFVRQFIGLDIADRTYRLRRDGGEIDAITGATISSRAVVEAVEKAAAAYNKFNAGIKSNAEQE